MAMMPYPSAPMASVEEADEEATAVGDGMM